MALPHREHSEEREANQAVLLNVHEEFEARVAEDPHRVAVVTAAGTTSYGELDRRANLIAAHLLEVTDPTDEIIAVLADRSPETVAIFLGVLKAGRGYLPLDPNYPQNRLQLLISDSKAPVLPSNDDLLARIAGSDYRRIARPPERRESAHARPLPTASSADLAYVTYTSGSTGVPKGALLNHGGLARLIDFTRSQMQIGPGDRILQFASLSFDASVWETFCALTSGAILVLGDQDSLAPGPHLHELMNTLGVTIALLSPSVLSVLPSEGLGKLRIVVAGTEKCSEEIARRWGKGRRFFNAYGPTETTVYSTIYELTDDAVGPPPIGRPIPRTGVHILDEDLKVVAFGESGELCISGEGVARGYLNRPEMTASRFITCDAADGRIVYRTGDRCRFLPSGDIEYLGRIDRQVKIRGFRVEPGEIETVLEQQDEVASAVIVAGRAASGLLELWAYVKPQPGANPNPQALLSALSAILPGYMVPTALQVVEQWPLTPHNKVDVAALPPPFRPSLVGRTEARSSDTIEARIAELFTTVRPETAADASSSMFDLGFTSLDIARLLWEIQATFGIALTYSAVFNAGTASAIADIVRRSEDPVSAPAICVQPAPLVAVTTPLPPSRVAPLDARTWPVSLLQRDLYMAELLTGRPGMTLTDYLRIPLPFDPVRLQRAVQALAARHELLRASFEDEAGDIVFHVHDTVETDVTLPASGTLSSLGDIALPAANAPLFRLSAQSAGNSAFDVRIDLSHLIADGAAMELVKRDILLLYREEELPSIPLTYSDYVHWQNLVAAENQSGEACYYWTAELAGGPHQVVWPGGSPHVQAGGGISVQTSALSGDLTSRVLSFARAHRIIPMMAVAGIFAIALHAATGRRDLMLGSVVSSRRYADLMDIVGPFLSLVPLRLEIDPEKSTFQFFERIREKVLNGFAYQDFDFNDLYRRTSQVQGNVSGLPFNVGFTMHVVRNRTTLETYERMSWPLDLNVEGILHEGQLELHLIHRLDVLPSNEVARLAQTMADVAAMLDTASTVPLGEFLHGLRAVWPLPSPGAKN
ncbi:amino acid adenylation domain-containing protein [Rhizobium laguerreae]|uniref:amino acid adenylation domain-containing protein n=1 Tax=Rhizobium laguerreae TaxID=1076926 RepID=UPI001C905A6D|nr:amino acid adenylation domain-containing protein [Rhizobium laguerreae]MBY3203453.1 amino acid adenylation domain-containing protein [Rhizobium laguerreae]